MPIYEYRCTSCGEVFEVFHMAGEGVEPRCPKCLGKGERVISPVGGFVFKGSGFYVTDYRGGEKTKREGSGKEEKSKKKEAEKSES